MIVLFESGIGAVQGIGPQGFLARHLLVGIKKLAVLHLARDAGIKPRNRVDVLDRRIRAVGDDRARAHELPPDISAFFRPLRPEPFENPRPVRGAVDRLHRGDDAETAEPGDILQAQMLGVLDAPADVLRFGMRLEGFLVDVQVFAVRPVADGVDAELKPVLDRDFRGFLDALDRIRVEADARRQVRVRFEEPGAVRAEGAVDEPLDRADGKMVGAVADQLEFLGRVAAIVAAPSLSMTLSRTPSVPASMAFL